MLISCPSCEKDYRVPSGAVPPEGREVRCSACSAVWFEPGIRAELMAAAAGGADVLPYPVTRQSAPHRGGPGTEAPPARLPASDAGPRDAGPRDTGPRDARAQQAALAVIYPPSDAAASAAPAEEPRLSEALGAELRRLRGRARTLFESLAAIRWRPAAKEEPARRSPGDEATLALRGRLKKAAANRMTPMRALGWLSWTAAILCTAFVLTARRDAVTAFYPPASNLYDRLPGSAGPGLGIEAEVARFALSDQGPAVLVTGRVINKGEEAVPHVLLTAVSDSGRETQVLPLPGVALPRGGERPFIVRALVPEGTTAVTVSVKEGARAAGVRPAVEAGPSGFAGPPPFLGNGR